MIYLLLSFLAGIILVTNIMLNGKLAKREGLMNGVFVYYFMTVITSIVLCGIMVKYLPSYSDIKSVPLPYFLGGLIGVLTTCIFNTIVHKIPAVYVVILNFAGQILTSAILDYVYLGIFSKGKIIGGVLFLIGLILNAKVDDKYAEEEIDLQETVS